MTFHFAVYTAGHGLEWTYDKNAIGYAELDACRTAFGPLPDFEAGERGFEGAMLRDGRIFAVRCFYVPQWDFRGRSAVYIAVAWISSKSAACIDFEKVLCLPEMNIPVKSPRTSFEVADAALHVSSEERAANLLGSVFEEDVRFVRRIGESAFAKIESQRGGENPNDKVHAEMLGCSARERVPHNDRDKDVNWRRRVLKKMRQHGSCAVACLVAGALAINGAEWAFRKITEERENDGSGGISQESTGAARTRAPAGSIHAGALRGGRD